MRPSDFNRAWEERPRRWAASLAQRRRIEDLAAMAGVEMPRVLWSQDADEVIDRLERMVREPTLGAMG
jgi:hypothetical protein